ncbi:MAG TPA: hypothetical protein PLG59_03160 [bacterium]|nr:hypothetical protein [bacterium]HQO33632.1 hypothetical protein [bacterium]HQP98194.1 hypothetical protein [bacterium]
MKDLSHTRLRKWGVILGIGSVVGFALSTILLPLSWVSDYVKVSLTMASFLAFAASIVILYNQRMWPFN